MRRRALVGGVAAMGVWGLASGAEALFGQDDQPAPLEGPLWTASDHSVVEPQATCVDGESLAQHDTVGAARIVYEVDQSATSMRFDAGFHRQLVAWLDDWQASNPYGPADQLWSQGAFYPKDGCASWHAAGRALDFARLKHGDDLLVTCRRDLWQGLSASDVETWEKRYWCLAASLNLHFEYVLTHLFDDEHVNHIHVDNGVSGSGASTFRSTSRVQNQSVQAICRTLWGVEGEVTGAWADTQRMSEGVLRSLRAGDLREQGHWQAFLRASVGRG